MAPVLPPSPHPSPVLASPLQPSITLLASGDVAAGGAASTETPHGLPLAPQSTWHPPSGCTWAPIPTGNKKSPAYNYFVAEYNSAGEMDRRTFVCVHKDHLGHPSGRVAYAGGPTNLNRHLKDCHDIEESLSRGDASSTGRGKGVRAEQGLISTLLRAPPKPYSRHHCTQRAFYFKQVDKFISSLSPESLVEDPSYVAMIAAANPLLTTLSRSSLSRATSSRFQALHDEVRAALDCVSVCHVNTDMWTSLANEPFGSFVIS